MVKATDLLPLTSQYIDGSSKIVSSPSGYSPAVQPNVSIQQSMAHSPNLFNQQVAKRSCAQVQQQPTKQARIGGQKIMQQQARGQSNIQRRVVNLQNRSGQIVSRVLIPPQTNRPQFETRQVRGVKKTYQVVDHNGQRYRIERTDHRQPVAINSPVQTAQQTVVAKAPVIQRVVTRPGVSSPNTFVRNGRVLKPQIIGNPVTKQRIITPAKNVKIEYVQNQRMPVENKPIKTEQNLLKMPNKREQNNETRTVKSFQQVQQIKIENLQKKSENQSSSIGVKVVSPKQITIDHSHVVIKEEEVFPIPNFDPSQVYDEEILMSEGVKKGGMKELCLQKVLNFAKKRGIPQPFKIKVYCDSYFIDINVFLLLIYSL